MICGEMVLRIGNRLQTIAIQPDFPSNLPSLVLIVTRTNIELIHAARGKPEHRRGPQVPPVNPDHWHRNHPEQLSMAELSQVPDWLGVVWVGEPLACPS